MTTSSRLLLRLAILLLMSAITMGWAPTPAGADGQSWAIVPSPNYGSGDNYLYSVACVSSTNCTATGYEYEQGHGVSMVFTWDGTNWTQVTSPNVASTDNTLVSIDCVSPSECTAIGSFVDSNAQGRYATLIERSTDPNPPLPPTTSTTTTTPTEPVVPTFTG